MSQPSSVVTGKISFDGVPPGAETAWRGLVRDGTAVPVRVSGLAGEWWAHREVLELEPGRPRTVLLSPFDGLVSDHHDVGSGHRRVALHPALPGCVDRHAALLERAPERRAVEVALAVVLVPGVGVRI